MVPDPTTASMAKETILIVDDDDRCRRMVRDILETQGYVLLEARDGEEALHVYEESHEKIDLLFTDIVMPKLDGVSLAERLNKLMPSMKVIFTSGYDMNHTNQRLENEEVNFIEKPYQPISLVQKVGNVLHPTNPSVPV
jgi:CheY-like chemotaxis protein